MKIKKLNIPIADMLNPSHYSNIGFYEVEDCIVFFNDILNIAIQITFNDIETNKFKKLFEKDDNQQKSTQKQQSMGNKEYTLALLDKLINFKA